jgi:hypothetical protein
MAPDFSIKHDDRATLIRFLNEQHETQAILWSYICHPTAFPDLLAISADYPGIVRDSLRRQHNSAAMAVSFIQGFAGDKRAPEMGGERGIKGLLKKLLRLPRFGRFDDSAYGAWTKSLTERIIAAFEPKNIWKQLVPHFDSARVKLPISDLIEDANKQQDFQLQRVTLSPSLNIIALSAEPVMDYEEKIANTFSMKKSDILFAGYIDDVFGYLPTEQMREEGGYEAEDFFAAFGLSGKFKGGIEQRVLSAVNQLKTSISTRIAS